MKTNPVCSHELTTRRDFLKTSAALASTAALGQFALERSAHAAGSDVIRIGLIGCGGRGTEAANNAMNAGKDIRLVAMADIFDERLKASREELQKAKPDQFAVKDDHCFIGFDACEKVLAYRIKGEKPWHYEGLRANMYEVEHAELFASIRNRQPINNGHYMCLSSALAIMAQIACYTGQMISWGQLMDSQRSFSLPRRYGWEVEPPVKPGVDGRYSTALQGDAEEDKWKI
ncbi:MAG: twin-arginine translocation signal domain-containing protein [Verrucomicrobiota bacterium]|jgi:hypothetical protein